MVIKYDKNSELCQNEFILIMSDNFDIKVYMKWITIKQKIFQLLNLSTQLDNINLGQPITKQCLIMFSLWCKKVTLTIKK